MDDSPLKLSGKASPSASQLNADTAMANDLSFAQALQETEQEEVRGKCICAVIFGVIEYHTYSHVFHLSFR
jgi:hypothetical protein